jgi:hypothetical protein
MAFDSVTLFEVHLDDATFVPPLLTGDDADHEAVTEGPADASGGAPDEGSREAGGRGRVGAVAGLVVLAGVAAAVARRRRAPSDDVGADGDADIAVEDAAVVDAAADPAAQ